MSFFNRLTAIIVSFALLAPMLPLEAKSKKGDKYFADGRLEEAKKNWDGALANYEKAVADDPDEIMYEMGVDRARFHASQGHLDRGLTLRGQGQLGEALIEFQKAYAINPGSPIATQELQETQAMILRERKRVEQTGKEAPPEVRALTPGQMAEKAEEAKIERMLPIPQLRPLKSGLVDLKMSGKARQIFETLGKYAGEGGEPPINVIFDPDYQPPTRDAFSIAAEGWTLEQAFDYISVISRLYWKALSPNTIFVTNDNPTKRRDFEEQVLKTIYLHNVSGPQEFQEVVNAVRTVPELTKVFPDTTQYAIVLKGEADRVALAEKIAHDLDKARPEVLLDFLVMEASSTFSKQITAAIASTGLNVPVNFTPRASIQVQGNANNSSTTSTTSSTSTSSTSTTTPNTPTGTTGTGTSSSVSGAAVPLSSLGHLASSDFSTTLPGALLQAAMSDAKTRVLQAPEMRAIDNVKAVLNIGEREPTASGSFQPGIGGVGINPLVNTQFQYIDIGVNIEVLCRVHSDTEVTVHMLLNITTVAGQVNLGGIQQPIIGQRKIEHDLRIREGEVALLGGLVTREDDKTITGIPGLSSIPLLGNLFKGSNVNRNRDDIVIAVIPHIIRKPDFTAENMRAIAVGAQSIKINYAPLAPDMLAVAPVGLGVVGAPGVPLVGIGAPPATAPATIGPATVPPAGAATTAPTTVPPIGAAGTVPPIGMQTPTPMPQMPAMPGLPGGPPPVTTAAGMPTTVPAVTGPPMTIPAMPPATAPPATGPPATAPPATAPPATAPPATAPPADGVALHFTPATIDAAKGATFTVSISADNANDLGAAPMQVKFDPQMLKLNDVAAGDLLAKGGATPLVVKNVQNESGNASIQVSRQPGLTGVNGSGAIVTLTFEAVAPGDTQIVAPNTALRNSQGQPAGSGSPVLSVHIK
jgi:general secretion pathway protein D